ncbi:hypothetical protein [Xanthomonas translucens]|uniref:hypothetical protein n=1 Tax=Xanthomonas campestris pv. translucens TaxID=343 RepID=UPI00071E83BA|nr:hypothetical protein [Xanthomonas translucens]WLA08656.1 hypothetical protein MO328_00135 [Xanthomonas translucens]
MRPSARPEPPLLNAHLDPLPAAPPHGADAAGPRPHDAADYRHYSLADYRQRRDRDGTPWRDLCPAYAFALRTHAGGWPRAPMADTDGDLAAHWEQVRGESQLDWRQARPVIKDAWQALDHLPAPALRVEAH